MSKRSDSLTAASKTKQTVPTRDDGTVGIRATLNNMGISNDKIGYNESSKTVTLGGKEFMKPSYIDEDAGVSYASPSDIQKSLTDFYSGTSDPIVKVSDVYTDYAGKYGLSADALGYSNDTVTIGGNPVDILYVDDSGKAWAFDSTVRSSIEDYIAGLGVKTQDDVLDEYNDIYLSRAYDLADELLDRDEFEYDPESDPVYQAYKKQYIREGNRAAQDTMADYAALTGGYQNSAAVTAAAQTEQYYRSMLTDKIPELAEQAYERYAEEYENDLTLLDSLTDMYDTAYENAYRANNKTVSNINSSLSSNAERDSDAYERYWNSLMNAQEYEWNEKQNSQDYDWTEILNGQQQTSNYLDIENSRYENMMQQIYMRYYDEMLQNQVDAGSLENRLTQEKINQLILQNMLL